MRPSYFKTTLFNRPFPARRASSPPNILPPQQQQSGVPERIVHLLEKGQSVNIIAASGAGKTTLLRRILDPEFMESCRVKPEQFLITGVTGEDILGCSIDAFWKQLIIPGLLESAQSLGHDQLAQEIEQVSQLSDPLHKIVDEIFYRIESHSSHLRPILVWDDFDWVQENSEFNLDLFNFLRSLAITYEVTYLVASERPLDAYLMDSSASRNVSPFFNIFYSISLSEKFLRK